ncbi:hypothetical protein [Rhodoferax sp.]|uniref:hypothetical protein n=1 Tax=Rhodoferax sp. TaxID=50421 RepID=UPI0027328375|nr:hypothetical protein [Rhodoferax sp.]MDP3192346.1 hypothetical protein [Rhodoferax sp.]
MVSDYLCNFVKKFSNGKIALLFMFAWLAIVGMSLQAYEGSKFVFTFFSVTFMVMLWVAFYKEFNYGYFFLSVLLFLGFWIKLVHHLMFPAPYLEAVGSFSHSSAAWDEVLSVAIVSAIGLIFARLIWVALTGFLISRDTSKYSGVKVPVWYDSRRKFLWAGVLVLIVFFSMINATLGINQIGLAPRTILTFPLNALISWMLNFGLVTIIATFLWWDVSVNRGPLPALYVVLVEALFSSVSMLSRGVFIFHVIPQLTAYYRHRKRFISLTRWQALLIVLMVALFFALGFLTVDTLRGYYYRSNTDDFRSLSRQNMDRLSAKRQEKGQLEAELRNRNGAKSKLDANAELDQLEQEVSALEAQTLASQRELQDAAQSMSTRVQLLFTEFWMQLPAVLKRALSLATDRWIGLEGVMAVQSYPDKSVALLREGLMERYADGIVPMYQHISKSIYTGMDPNQWKFGSLPGAPAFLYYSGSLLVVFLGMTMLTIFLFLFEFAIRWCTNNPFLASFYGFAAANTVAQFGVVPRQIFPVMVTWACGIAIVGFVQCRLGGVALARLGKLVNRKS